MQLLPASGTALLRVALFTLLIGTTAASRAATIELQPGQSFESAAEGLGPGDTLIVHAGTYMDSGRISITVKGTAEAPVVIKAATGEARPRIGRRPTDPVQNTLNIEGATYLTITGLEITGNSGDGGDGINLSGTPSHITLEDLKIHDISVGVNFRSSMDHITVRRTEIYNTNDTGEGMYVGCHDGDCAVHDSLIENNWIHNSMNAEQGDGIEIKKGSYANIVRDNVIHDTHYPCIILYGTDGHARNVVERNVMWNCGDTGMQVAADTIIRNNIILQQGAGGGGFTSQDHNGVTPNNLDFVHNTVIGGSPCLRLNNWGGKTGLVFANNAIYCANGDYAIGGVSGVTAAGNVFATAPPSFASTGYLLGHSAAQDLVDPNARNVYPTSTSTLVGAAASAWVTADDFNGTQRSPSRDSGAYTRTTNANPGCAIVAGFKCATVSLPEPPPPAPAPLATVSLTANPTSIDFQAASTLSWTSTNAASCTAEGGWSGSKPTSGSQSTGALIAQQTYTLKCVNADNVAATSSVTVQVGAAPTPPPNPSPPNPAPPTTPPPQPTDPPQAQSDSGGGGALDPLLLLLLAGALVAAVRQRALARES